MLATGERAKAGRCRRPAACPSHAARISRARRLVGQVDVDQPVQPPRPRQRRVQQLGPVGGRQDHDPLATTEAVELDQQLVEGLRPLGGVVDRATPPAADRVDEQDRRCEATHLGEEITDACRALPYEDLHELRRRDGDEPRVGFPGDGAGEQRLAGARRARQEVARRDARAQAFEAGRVSEVLADLGELLDRPVEPGDVGERDAVGIKQRLAHPPVTHAQAPPAFGGLADAFERGQQGRLRDRRLARTRGQERRLVHDARQVRARHPHRLVRHRVEIDIGAEYLAAGVDGEDAAAAGLVGEREPDGPVEAARAQSAGSRTSGRLVAATTMRLSVEEKPSISARSWLSAWLCSSAGRARGQFRPGARRRRRSRR